MVTAVGGGVVRDVLLNSVPIILHKEIYALPALLAAATSLRQARTKTVMAASASLTARVSGAGLFIVCPFDVVDGVT